MSMSHRPILHPACVSCLVKKQIDRYPASAPREQVLTYMRRLGQMMAALPDRTGGPAIMEAITDIRREVFGEAAAEFEVDYAALKTHFNALMTGIAAAENLPHRIEASPAPLRTALGYAMTGNFIDFGAMDSVDEAKLRALLEESPDRIAPDLPAYNDLTDDLAAARRLVLLTDNCGEIVMDKLLLREMHRLNPQAEMTVIVRGEPVLNDATMEDALAAGLDEHAAVMGNGSCIAGTCLGRISPQARETIDGADMLIAKGQANFETLRRCGRNVYYIFLCKCDLFASRFGVERFQGMLLRDRDS